MNEVIQNILNRRSVRVYTDEQIRQEDLDLILQAGLYAPSGCNMQPWHFTVVQNPELISELSVESKKEFADSDNEMFRNMANNPNYNLFYNAQTIIVVSVEESAVTAQLDCAAATENMMLAAESLGIGACWIGLVIYLFEGKRVKEYSEKLQIPKGFKPYYALTLGYKKYDAAKPPKRREGTVTYIK